LNSKSDKSIEKRVTEKTFAFDEKILEELVDDNYPLSLIKKCNRYDDEKTEQCVSAKVKEHLLK